MCGLGSLDKDCNESRLAIVFFNYVPLLSRLSEIAGCLKSKWPVN